MINLCTSKSLNDAIFYNTLKQKKKNKPIDLEFI